MKAAEGSPLPAMTAEDYIYLCDMLGNLSGIPARLYRGKELLHRFSTVMLPVDPITPEEGTLLSLPEHISCHITALHDYYCVLTSEDLRLVVGPSREVDYTERELRQLAFELSVPREQLNAFLQNMRQIVRMPMNTMVQIMCAMNFAANGREKLTLDDVIGGREYALLLEKHRTEERILREADISHPYAIHNTLGLEEQVMDIIENGDLPALRRFVGNAPSVRPGVMAFDSLRQVKNTLIVTASLASRAAIRGGLDPEEALSMSDSYIRECELLEDIGRIQLLSFTMIRAFTEKVQRIREPASKSELVNAVANFVQQHLFEPLKTEEIASALFVSRQHLSRRFHEETGMTLYAYIQQKKTEEAKRLLRFTDQSISLIALHLGFSSQSHFTRVFRQMTGKTPGEFRADAAAAR